MAHLYGIDTERLQQEVKTAPDKRLHRLVATMKSRWSDDPPWERFRNGSHEPLTDKELLATILWIAAGSELGSRNRQRLHDANHIRVQVEPVALKRGVSWRELIDVFQQGSVLGALNAWSQWDERRLVLWGDDTVPDRWLLTQANQLDRQALVVLCAEQGLPLRHDAVEERERKQWVEDERARRRDADWTSAVLVTHPLTGSTVWPRHNRINQMPGMDEHGLPAGMVTIDDIHTVRLYKEVDLIFEGTVEKVMTCLRELRSPDMMETIDAAHSPGLR